MPPTPDGAPLALSSIRSAYPWLRQVFTDGGYAGPKLEQALAGQVDWTVEIVKRPDANQRLRAHRAPIGGRAHLCWARRCRRLAKDFEATIKSALARILVANIRRLTRKLARP